MESATGMPEPVSLIPKPKRHCRRRVVLGLLGMLVLLLILSLTLTPAPNPAFAWLSQAEIDQLTHPGSLTRLKDKLMHLTAPLWRRYWSTQPQILIDSRLLTLSATATDQAGLGAPVATNSHGLRAWTLSSAELGGLLQRLQAAPHVSLLSRPRIQTANGAQGQVFFGNTSYVAGTNLPVGVTMELVPQMISGSIKLTLGVSSTEIVSLASGYPAAVRTNLAVACRVCLSNAGGLVVEDASARDATGKTHWLIVSPIPLDARGNPIKP